MATLSRSLTGFLCAQSLRLPCSVRIGLCSARGVPHRARIDTVFSSSLSLRQYTATKPRLAIPAANPYRSVRSVDPVLRTVEATRKTVLLYKARPRRLYTFVVYAFACSLVGGGLWTLNWRYELPKDLPFFVGPTYVMVAFILMGLGLYVFTAPVSRCASIEAIPGAFGGPAQLRITARYVPLPIMKPKVIIANIGEATISEKTYPVVRELQEAERARRAKVTEGLEGVFILFRWMEIFARATEQKWTSFFLRFKFTVLRFGNVALEVQDRKWKIDCGAYLLEDGKAIDRLISTV
ncbi:hypothetical protein GQ43DRAFT_479516 [Delitschia confertaspora ATCC 74209]|uniref:Uncharacterized protein n=1 Tax=Delitschia confertaspora ATCC 74209 TaxID=1513339 RepID=A0A9P4MRE2_9PLEO|nr:hypothetical protein GQ43DRAFT_479516 [Delitschia confertaspora ATCC 74209]